MFEEYVGGKLRGAAAAAAAAGVDARAAEAGVAGGFAASGGLSRLISQCLGVARGTAAASADLVSCLQIVRFLVQLLYDQDYLQAALQRFFGTIYSRHDGRARYSPEDRLVTYDAAYRHRSGFSPRRVLGGFRASLLRHTQQVG